MRPKRTNWRRGKMRKKQRVMPEKLQKNLIENALKKKIKEACLLNPMCGYDKLELEDIIDWDCIDKSQTYHENLNEILKHINKKFGICLSDEPDPRDLEDEQELKIFQEQLRMEFNKEGFDINSDDFGYLLETCHFLFGAGIGHVKSLSGSEDVKPIKKIENTDIETIAKLLKRKPQEMKPKINIWE